MLPVRASPCRAGHPTQHFGARLKFKTLARFSSSFYEHKIKYRAVIEFSGSGDIGQFSNIIGISWCSASISSVLTGSLPFAVNRKSCIFRHFCSVLFSQESVQFGFAQSNAATSSRLSQPILPSVHAGVSKLCAVALRGNQLVSSGRIVLNLLLVQCCWASLSQAGDNSQVLVVASPVFCQSKIGVQVLF